MGIYRLARRLARRTIDVMTNAKQKNRLPDYEAQNYAALASPGDICYDIGAHVAASLANCPSSLDRRAVSMPSSPRHQCTCDCAR